MNIEVRIQPFSTKFIDESLIEMMVEVRYNGKIYQAKRVVPVNEMKSNFDQIFECAKLEVRRAIEVEL